MVPQWQPKLSEPWDLCPPSGKASGKVRRASLPLGLVSGRWWADEKFYKSFPRKDWDRCSLQSTLRGEKMTNAVLSS